MFVAGDRRQSIMSPYITPQGGENIAVATVQKYKSQIHNFQKEVDSVSEFVQIKLKTFALVTKTQLPERGGTCKYSSLTFYTKILCTQNMYFWH